MSSGEKADNVFRALLKELGCDVTEEAGEKVLAFKSEQYKFSLNVHRGEDGSSFEKTVLENTCDGSEACKKFAAVVDALSDLLKAQCNAGEEKPEEKSEEKPEGEGEAKGEEKKEEETPAAEEEKPAEPAADA